MLPRNVKNKRFTNQNQSKDSSYVHSPPRPQESRMKEDPCILGATLFLEDKQIRPKNPKHTVKSHFQKIFND